MRALHGNPTVVAIGFSCGFVDQSALARQLKNHRKRGAARLSGHDVRRHHK
jgi:transcriptional regulator GlxA family with amidase domain